MEKYFTILFVLIFISFNLSAQNNINSDLENLRGAYLNIQKGNYTDALPYYKKMLDTYPKDPTYNYFVGRCLLFTDADITKAIKHLRFASTQSVPSDVYFYLGLAYLQTYQFEDAIANFRWFEKSANKKQIKELELNNYISMAQNGLYLIKYFKKPLVYSKKKAAKRDFYKSYETLKIEGNFVDRYEYLNHPKDSNAQQSILYVPNYLEKNEVLYFSAINKKRGDLDLYRITRLADNSWSEPENLGDKVNTPFDENYPFIHSDGATLYFASKGHYSMGGYDLYKSSWNWENQEWTEPENLDFPINSPFDDILFVPTSDKKEAFFASDRDRLKDNYRVYKLKLENFEPYQEYKTNDQIKEYSSLDVNIVIEDKKPIKKDDERLNKKQNTIVKIKENESFIQKSEYDSLLNLAVNYQLQADSIKWIIDDKRMIFDKTENGQDRAKLGNEIVLLEKTIYSLQKKADICYEKVREIEQKNLASRKSIYEPKEELKLEVKVDEIAKKEEKKKIFTEPEMSGISKSKLESIKDEEELSILSRDFGLRINLPSIYNSKNPIKVNEKLPEGIIYMIQLGAFSSTKDPSTFNGLEPLTCIQKENSNVKKYYAGKFWQLNEAEKKLSIVKSKGFKDAYIVAFNNSNVIPINSAIKLESKNVPKPILNQEVEKTQEQNKELGIIYVVKGTFIKSDSIDIEKLKEILDSEQELYVEENQNIFNFIIKSFSTFDDALKIKSKIEPILNKDLEIHAYFAENQIPIEQARKITK